MPRNGLTTEKVVEAAVVLIENSGFESFSMRGLAESLDVKTASLYNHIDSMDMLLKNVCAYALRAQYEMEMQAIAGKVADEGIFALANAYRQFAKEHRELYRLIMNTAASSGNEFQEISQCIVEPFWCVLEGTNLNQAEKEHWQRVLRGIIHGFVSQEEAGFFSHLSEPVEESFQIAIQCYIDGLEAMEQRKKR